MTQTAILIVIALLVLLNLLVAIASWWRHDGLAARVTRIEAAQSGALSPSEVRDLFKSISHLDGRVDTAVKIMQSIQEHLLERD